MNRRQIMISMGAAMAASLTAIPVWARPAMSFGGRVTWHPGTLDSPHALLTAQTIGKIIKAGRIYTSGETYFGNKITLSDPTFTVIASDIMWHSTRGYRYEPALEIEIRERGVLIGYSRMYSNRDFEAYYERPLPTDEKMYGYRVVHTPYEQPTRYPLTIRDEHWQKVAQRDTPRVVTSVELEERLGKEAVTFDDRWIRAALERTA